MISIFKEQKITSPFGMRKINGKDDFHKGIDIVGIGTDKIICPFDGIVKSSKIITDKTNPTWQWGNYVRIDDNNGFKHYFCHMQKRLLSVGQRVKKGQIIGIQGNTGYSLGIHCHYEIRNKNDISIDPEEFWKMNYKEVIDFFVEKEIIDSPEYWIKACDIVKNLPTLFEKIGAYIKG